MFRCLNVKIIQLKVLRTKKKNKKKVSLNGFTLVELLVVIGIIAILTLILFVNYQPFKREFALQRAATKLAQDIRRMEGMAISSQSFSSCGSGYKYQYGIFFKQSQPEEYNLFVDCNNNGDYDSGIDKIIETIDLESGISILSLSSSFLRIVFSPPDPIVTIKPSASSAVITLSTSNGQSKIIEVNKAGLIYVK